MPPIDPVWAAIGVGVPLLIGAAVAHAAPRVGEPGGRAAAWSVGLAAAVMAGAWATFGGPWSGRVASYDRLALYVAPLAAVTGVVLAAMRSRQPVAWLIRVVAAAAMPALLLWNQVASAGDPYALWSESDATRYLVAIPLATLVLWIGLDRLAARRRALRDGAGDASHVFAVAMLPAVLAGATVAAGSESVGRMAAALGIAVGGAWLAMVARRRAGLFNGVDTFVLLYAALTAYSRVYAPAMGDGVALALLWLPLGLWAVEWPAAKLPGWAVALARPAVVATLGAAVAGYAYQASITPDAGNGGGEIVGDTGYTADEAYSGSTDTDIDTDDADADADADEANPWLELAARERGEAAASQPAD